MFQKYFRLDCDSCPQNGVCCCWRRIVKSSGGGWRCFVNNTFQNAPKCTILKAKVQKFSGEEAQPQTPPLMGRSTPPPHAPPSLWLAATCPGPPSSKNPAPPLNCFSTQLQTRLNHTCCVLGAQTLTSSQLNLPLNQTKSWRKKNC